MTEKSINFDFYPCLHRHVVIETRGSIRMVAGEIVDDIQEQLRCIDCLEVLTEEEVQSAWLGYDTHFIDPSMEEMDYGDL
ncbi:hypothetical protein ACFLXB_04180 [Chloroflexota bacterium]